MSAEKQAPIGSGFGHGSTAMDVLEGFDLSGRNVIVTGGYSGIGLETVRALASKGARVIVPARRPDTAKDALTSVAGEVEIASMDLADLNSVKAFTDDILSRNMPLHMLINNAGIMACPEARVGPNWESQFGINHMGHFSMTNWLRPALCSANGARVVALSSTAHKISDIRWDDPHFVQGPYDKWRAYGQAKTANSLFAVGLNALWHDDGIEGFAVHPGGIMTPLQRHLQTEEMIALGWLDESGEMPPKVRAMFKSPEQGGATATWAATNPQLAGLGGVYCEDCEVATLGDDTSPRWAHVQPHAVNEDSAHRLWEVSQRLLSEA